MVLIQINSSKKFIQQNIPVEIKTDNVWTLRQDTFQMTSVLDLQSYLESCVSFAIWSRKLWFYIFSTAGALVGLDF